MNDFVGLPIHRSMMFDVELLHKISIIAMINCKYCYGEYHLVHLFLS